MGYISTLNRTNASPYDKDTELRDYSKAEISATTSETAIELAIPEQSTIRAVLNHAAIGSVTPGTAEWTVTVEISADNIDFTAVRTWVLGADATELETAITGVEMTSFVNDATHIRASATKTGTPGNLTYGLILTIC